MRNIYAGIGSRSCPVDKLSECKRYAKYLASIGYILRSGGADGCDSAFESGCDSNHGIKEIYLPWKGFNNNTSLLYSICDNAMVIAEKFHPNWKKLKEPARKLMARNTYQVLGRDLNTPVDFIICWTENARMVGGTAQALRMALEYNIRVFNIADFRQQNGLDNIVLFDEGHTDKFLNHYE